MFKLVKKMWRRISDCRIVHSVRYRIWERKYNLEIGKKAYVENTNFEGYNLICDKCKICNCHIGLLSYIGKGSELYRTKVGKYCSIGPGVKIVAGNHPTREYVSTHPVFYSKQKFAGMGFSDKQIFEEYSYADEQKKYWVEIGNDVWIGAGAAIINGCKIGDGAIVAAGAVVAKDVTPYTIVGGVPAREIRKRFTDEQIDFLLQFKWWERDITWLQENIEQFDDIELFMEKMKG